MGDDGDFQGKMQQLKTKVKEGVSHRPVANLQRLVM